MSINIQGTSLIELGNRYTNVMQNSFTRYNSPKYVDTNQLDILGFMADACQQTKVILVPQFPHSLTVLWGGLLSLRKLIISNT